MLVQRAPQRASIVTRGRHWAQGVLVSGVLVAVAALVALWFVVPRHADTPEQVVHDFVTAASCAKLLDLATDNGDKLLGGRGCDAMIRAAKGERTYADQSPRQLTRRLSIEDAVFHGGQARVNVQVTYGDAEPPAPAETLVVVLVKAHGCWRVDEWGLPGA